MHHGSIYFKTMCNTSTPPRAIGITATGMAALTTGTTGAYAIGAYPPW